MTLSFARPDVTPPRPDARVAVGPAWSRRAALAGAAAVLLAGTAGAAAAPKAELWPRWTAFTAGSAMRVDHAAWTALLSTYLITGADGINRLAYGRVTAANKARLDDYLQGLALVPVARLDRAEQAAYWINLYNALTVQVVLAHYPVESIRDISISPGLFTRGPWGRKLIEVDDEPLSLDDIEHRILRPIWRDPRIHYALNCASLGCPNLAEQAYDGTRLAVMLERGARAYVNQPRGVRFDEGDLVVSSLYVWFQDDFGGSDAAVIAHLKRYAAPALAAKLSAVTEISDDDYDWRLNDAE